MTVESFMKMLKPRLEARTPFLAYWHENGFMVLNTGVIEYEEYDVVLGDPQTVNNFETHHARTPDEHDWIISQARRKGQRIDEIKVRKKHRKVKASAITKMRKIIAQLQKDPRIGPVYTVEFDGCVLVKTGPDADILSSLNAPEMAQN